MYKLKSVFAVFLILVQSLLCGCTPIGDKSASMIIVYMATTFFAFLLLILYCLGIKKKQPWFYVLYTSVFVVNIGYLMLAMAKTLDAALWANRVAYLGSVFLPLSMLKSIQKISKLKYPKWLSGVLIGISAIVFFIAASPGWLDIYYKSVSLETVGGVSVLNKEYGSWHGVYLVYLLGYFVTMVATAIHAFVKKKIESTAHAVIVLIAVFANICVWLIEQLVKFDFEFLSISYIITEIFLLGVYLLIQTQEQIIATLKAQITQNSNEPPVPPTDLKKESIDFIELCNFITNHLDELTTRERELYNCLIAGKTTNDILVELDIKENTLKFHRKNLYSKLGVTSRKQLVECAKAIALAKVNEE